MANILPYNAPCPKCGRIEPATRYEPEITEEAYQKAELLFTEDQKKSCQWRKLPLSPCEEHLVRKCQCGHLFWTRTADYESEEE